jgi:membrane fusion protein, multidrug efflux system
MTDIPTVTAANDTRVPPAKDPTAPNPTRRKRSAIAAGVVTLLAVVLLRRHARGDAPPVTAPPSATITVASASKGNIGTYIEAIGTVTPLATVNVYSQITGRVVAVHFTEGQLVKKGNPLIDIDPSPYLAQLHEAQGTLQHDQAVLKEAQMDLARYKEAADQEAIPRQNYEDQRLSAEQNRGTVKYDLGQVEYAKAQLGYCHLASPIGGRVGLRLIDLGNTIFTGSTNPLLVVTQLQPITVVFNVAEDDLAQVRDQITHPSNLTVDAYDRAQQVKLASGTLLALDNQIDTTTGTARFRAQFDNNDLALFPNQFVNARLLVKTLEGAVLVPIGAIQRNGTQTFVYAIHGDKARVRDVTVAATDGDVSAVGGIEVGDVVAVTGFDKLQDGAKVVIQNPQPHNENKLQAKAAQP